MGIDIYLSWDNMTEEEKKARYTGFSVTAGNVGYLREAYHGEPYATKVLVPEAFAAKGVELPSGEKDYSVAIPNATLVKRLPATLAAAAKRERVVYKAKTPDPAVLKAFEDFVALHGKKERAGLHPRIEASA